MSKPSGLDFLKTMIAGGIAPAPICATLRFELSHAEEGLVRFVGHPHESQENPMGTIHGGWYATLLDSAMGSAVLTTLDASLGYTTAQLAVHLTRTITKESGPITAEGRVVHRGSRVATAEGRLTDASGKLYAHATTTCLVFPRT